MATQKSKMRGTKLKYANLYNRTWELVEYIEEYVLPKLKTTRKKRCAYLVKRVNNLL